MTDTLSLSSSQTLRVITSTPSALVVDATWAHGPPPRAHFHPEQPESFQLLEGALTVELDGSPPLLLRPGESLEVPARAVHRMWNAGSEPTRATWEITPRLRTEEMFRFIDRGVPPHRAVLMLWRFRREFRLGSARP